MDPLPLLLFVVFVCLGLGVVVVVDIEAEEKNHATVVPYYLGRSKPGRECKSDLPRQSLLWPEVGWSSKLQLHSSSVGNNMGTNDHRDTLTNFVS